MKKHLKTLGLQEGATNEEIQAAYERLSNDLDPKNNDNEAFFKEEFEKVLEAYKALSSVSILAKDKSVQQPKVTKNEASTNEKLSAKNKISNSKKQSVLISVLYSAIISLLISMLIFIIEYYIIYESFMDYDTIGDLLYDLITSIYYDDLDILILYFSICFILIFFLQAKKKIKSLRLLKHFDSNPKTAVLFLLFILLTKAILHYTLYPTHLNLGDHLYIIKESEFTLFTELPGLFIPSIIVVFIIFWFFNIKIKF